MLFIWVDYHFLIDMYDIFKYFKFKSFVGYMGCRYLFLVCGLNFHALNGAF